MAKDPVYQSVLNLLVEKINNETFKVGQCLPPERDLAEMFSVSRGSLREALRVLDQQGVTVAKKDGRYLLRASVKRSDLQDAGTHLEISDLIEARSVLEDKIVEFACTRATDDDLAAIKSCLDNGALELVDANKKAALDYDNLFHISVANAAHNLVFARVYESNLEILNKLRSQSLSSARRRKEILHEHQMIYEAIRDKDVLMARLAIRLHLRSIEKRYLLDKNADLQSAHHKNIS